jgi:hypothetical protein
VTKTKKQQDREASTGAFGALMLVGGIIIGMSGMSFIEEFQPKPPAPEVVSKADYDALFKSFYTEIEGERVRANKFQQDFEALTLKAASDEKDWAVWGARVMADDNILRNQPPKIVKVRNNAALNECLGQLDEARALLHTPAPRCARQLGE